MYISKLMINEALESNNLDFDKISKALKELNYNIVSVYDLMKKNDNIEICHIGSSHKTDENDFMCLVDTGEELPVVSISHTKPEDQAFVLFAKNLKTLENKGKIEPIRRGELKTEGHLTSLFDLGYENKKLTDEQYKGLISILSPNELQKKYNQPIGLEEIGFNDYIYEIDTNESFYEIASNLAFYFRKKPIRAFKDELDSISVNEMKQIKVESKKDFVIGSQKINVRNIIEIRKTSYQFYTYDLLMLDKINIKISPLFYENLSNIIEYETNVKVVFLDEDKIIGDLEVKIDDDILLISNNKTVIYSNNGYEDQTYIPTKESKNITAVYVFDTDLISNHEYAKNRVGYWMSRYLISKSYSPIYYVEDRQIEIKKINFDMSLINTINDDKKRIRQITKLLRFFDVDIKEFDEHTGEFIITNLNNKYKTTNEILELINEKIKLNKV